MVQKPVKSKSPQLPVVKPVPFPRDIHVASFIHISPDIFYACIACVCVWYVVLFCTLLFHFLNMLLITPLWYNEGVSLV